jgi:hypothetical protein
MSRKVYPDNYPKEIRRIIDTMLFPQPHLELAGSISLRSQLYWGDIDCLQKVDVPNAKFVANHLQEVIRKLRKIPNTYIPEAKIGSVEEYRILPRTLTIEDGKVLNYDMAESRRIVERIPFLTSAQKEKYKKLLVPNPTPRQVVLMKEVMKDHILRWTSRDILDGKVRRPCGKMMSLEEAVMSPTMVKVDVISLLENSRFVEISMIYDLYKDGKAINERFSIEHNIRENIITFSETGQWFKVLKRIFSLANIHGRTDTAEIIIPILNSDLGRIYQVISDASTLIDMLDRHIWDDEMAKEVDGFKYRLSNVYQNQPYLANERELFNMIDKATNRRDMRPVLEMLVGRLEKILNDSAKIIMRKAGLIPLPTEVLP